MSIAHRILTLIFSLLITAYTFAQVSVSGLVTNETGEALAGANVYLSGTSLGSATGADGKYEIKNVPSGDYNLVFSYL